MDKLELALQAIFTSAAAAAGVFVKNSNSQKQVGQYLNLAATIAATLAALRASKAQAPAAAPPLST